MTSIKTWISEHTDISQQPLIKNEQLRLLICHVLNQNQAWLFSHPDFELSSAHLSELDHCLIQLKQGKPLAYIIGNQAFWDFDLFVNENTLIPRPDTETLIETCISLLKDNPPASILDLGTGSGAIAIALAKVFKHSEVTALDASLKALKVAEVNSQHNDMNNIQFINSDWFKSLEQQQFDLIVSNPPYIAEDDHHLNNLTHEPYEALVAGENGLSDFKKITNDALAFLSNGGLLIFEHGWQQKTDVQLIFEQAGYINIESFKDLAGNDRVTCGFKKL